MNQWKNTSSVITWFKKLHINILPHFHVLMWKTSIHLSPVIYLKNHLNLPDSSSKFLMMIYQSYGGQKKVSF